MVVDITADEKSMEKSKKEAPSASKVSAKRKEAGGCVEDAITRLMKIAEKDRGIELSDLVTIGEYVALKYLALPCLA